MKITPREKSRVSPFLACLATAVYAHLSIRPIAVLFVLLAREKKGKRVKKKTVTEHVDQQLFSSKNFTQNTSTINVYGLRSIAEVDEDLGFFVQTFSKSNAII